MGAKDPVPVVVAPVSKTAGSTELQAYGFGPFRLLPAERVLRRGERILPLPPKAFETLLLFVRNPGHLMSKAELIAALWPDSFVEEVNLANNISLLRKALDDKAAGSSFIQTVPRTGYRFLPSVTSIWKRAAGPGISVAEPGADRLIRFIALPFRILRGDESIEYLGRTLPDAISASLAALRSMTVRTSLLAARFEADADPRHIAQEAEVDLILSGTILCDGEDLRVQAELVEAPTATLLASYTSHTRLSNVFDVQDTLVQRIVEVLMLRLSDREKRTLRNDVPASAKAYEFFLRGTYVERERTVENLLLARDLYRECVEEDPNYAPAWARLGRCYRFLGKFGEEGPETLEMAKWAFHRAFALNPDLTLAHKLYTQIEADLGNAQAAMLRLLALAGSHPNDPEIYAGLVQACRFCGLLEESVAAHRRARRLDSRAVTSVSHTFFLMGDYARSLESYGAVAGYYLDAAVLAVTGREAQARDLLARRNFSGVRGGWMRTLIASLKASLDGAEHEALHMVRQALTEPGHDPECKFYLARHLAHGGASGEALAVIRELAAEGLFCSASLLHDPWLRALSGLPGFYSVIEMLRLRENGAMDAFAAAGGHRILA